MSHRYLVAAAALFFGAHSFAATVGGGVTPERDGACMTGIVDRYLAALVRHDASGLPLGRDVKSTENASGLKVGSEGLWVGASEAPTCGIEGVARRAARIVRCHAGSVN